MSEEHRPRTENPARRCDRAGQVRRQVGARQRGARADGLPVGQRARGPGRGRGYRRRALDRAVGRMSKRATWATERIAELAEDCRVRVGQAGRAAGHLVRHDGRLQVRGAGRSHDRDRGAAPCADWTTRVARAEARRGVASAAERDRPLALGLVRRILLVRPAARGVPRASPGPAEPAAPRGRLAGLGVCGRPRGGQDARRGLRGFSAGSTTAP